MGLISSNFRMMYLTAYRLTLENQIQYISSAKMDLCTSKDEILALGNNLDPDNPAVKEMEGRRDKLAVLASAMCPFLLSLSTHLNVIHIRAGDIYFQLVLKILLLLSNMS